MKGKPPQPGDPKKPRGFVYVDRRITSDWKWDARYRAAWLWLIVEAAFKDHAGLKRGQVRFSVTKSMELWGMTESMARRFLKRCEHDDDIKWERGHGGKSPIVSPEKNLDCQSDGNCDGESDGQWGIITLLNYDKYQSRPAALDGESDGQFDGESDGLPYRERKTKKEEEHASPSESVPVSDTEKPQKKSKKACDPRIKSLIDYFFTAYNQVRGTPYVVLTRDAVQIKRLLGSLSEEEIRARIDRYLADDDPFVAKQGYSLSFFASRINAYGESNNATRSNTERLTPRNASPQLEDLNNYQC